MKVEVSMGRPNADGKQTREQNKTHDMCSLSSMPVAPNALSMPNTEHAQSHKNDMVPTPECTNTQYLHRDTDRFLGRSCADWRERSGPWETELRDSGRRKAADFWRFLIGGRF